MPIPCPGSDTHSHIFGVGRDGPNPMAAFLFAFLVLLAEIATSKSLRRFLNQKCKDPCVKAVSGPTFSNFTVRIVQKVNGNWHCVMGGTLEARIDCQEPMVVPTSVTEAELLAKVMEEIRREDKEEKA